MEPGEGPVPEDLGRVFELFNVRAGDREAVESLKRTLRALKAKWTVAKRDAEDGHTVREVAKSAVEGIKTVAKLVTSLFEEEKSTIGRVGAAVWEAFGKNPAVGAIREAFGPLPESFYASFDGTLAGEFSEEGPVNGFKGPQEASMRVSSGGSITTTQKALVGPSRGLDALLSKMVSSNAKRLAFVEKMNEITVETDRRLANG